MKYELHFLFLADFNWFNENQNRIGPSSYLKAQTIFDIQFTPKRISFIEKRETSIFAFQTLQNLIINCGSSEWTYNDFISIRLHWDRRNWMKWMPLRCARLKDEETVSVLFRKFNSLYAGVVLYRYWFPLQNTEKKQKKRKRVKIERNRHSEWVRYDGIRIGDNIAWQCNWNQVTRCSFSFGNAFSKHHFTMAYVFFSFLPSVETSFVSVHTQCNLIHHICTVLLSLLIHRRIGWSIIHILNSNCKRNRIVNAKITYRNRRRLTFGIRLDVYDRMCLYCAYACGFVHHYCEYIINKWANEIKRKLWFIHWPETITTAMEV